MVISRDSYTGMVAFAAVMVFCSFSLSAQEENSRSAWGEDIRETKWETLSVFAGITALGLLSWDWGSSKSFRWNPEGWFGTETGSGGTDKLGHAFTSYAITNVFADRLILKGRPPERAALSAALTTQALMLYVELFDGYSDDHGFAREDVIMNLLGSSLAYARTVSPAFRDLLDYRMEYQPSGYKGFRPFSDYAGQKYLVALKFGGFNSVRNSPLRFLELQAGYYARGFSEAERADGLTRTRYNFVGLGLNLSTLFFGHRDPRESGLKRAGRLFFDHIEIPNTALRSEREI